MYSLWTLFGLAEMLVTISSSGTTTNNVSQGKGWKRCWERQNNLSLKFCWDYFKLHLHLPLTMSSISNRSCPTVLLATQTYRPLSAAVTSRRKSELSTCTIRPALLMRYVVATDSPEPLASTSSPPAPEPSPMRKVGTWRRLSRLVAVEVTPPEEEEEEEEEEEGVVSMEARYQVKVGQGCACVEQGNSTVSPDCTTRWRRLAMILGGIRDCGSEEEEKEKEKKMGN